MKYSYSRRLAYVTYTLVALNVIYFLYLKIADPDLGTQFMVEHGAMYAPYVVDYGEYYRLFTSMFMHFDVSHIMNNMLILFILGDNLERALGGVKYLCFYILCGLGASVISMIVNLQERQEVVSAGASGAIFGVIGGLLYAVVVNKGQLEDLSTRQMVVLIAFSLYFGLTSTRVDNVAHVAGLITGIILAAILYRKPKKVTMAEMRDKE